MNTVQAIYLFGCAAALVLTAWLLDTDTPVLDKAGSIAGYKRSATTHRPAWITVAVVTILWPLFLALIVTSAATTLLYVVYLRIKLARKIPRDRNTQRDIKDNPDDSDDTSKEH